VADRTGAGYRWMTKLTMRLDTTGIDHLLSQLSAAAEALPEFREALLSLLEAGKEIFLLHADDAATSVASEFVVRLDPSDAFLGLVAAFRARNPDLLLFEHLPLPVGAADSNTTAEAAQ
jgi:hypothetical protein